MEVAMRLAECGSVCAKEVKSRGFWRDVIVEMMATFLLVSVQCALPLSWKSTDTGSVGIQTGLGMGFIVATMAWTLGDFSGGHMNPAVSIAMAVLRKISVFRALMYTIAQCLGGIIGAAFMFGVTPAAFRDGLANTMLGPDVEHWQGVLIELWITFILVTTIIGSTNAKIKGAGIGMPPIIIGYAIALGIMSAFTHTGGSMNPARSLGPAVVMWAWLKDKDDAGQWMDVDKLWDDHWVYWVGPILGGVLAAGFYSLMVKLGGEEKEKVKHEHEMS